MSLYGLIENPSLIGYIHGDGASGVWISFCDVHERPRAAARARIWTGRRSEDQFGGAKRSTTGLDSRYQPQRPAKDTRGSSTAGAGTSACVEKDTWAMILRRRLLRPSAGAKRGLAPSPEPERRDLTEKQDGYSSIGRTDAVLLFLPAARKDWKKQPMRN